MSEDLRGQVIEAMARAYEQSGYDSISNDEITDETWEHIKTITWRRHEAT